MSAAQSSESSQVSVVRMVVGLGAVIAIIALAIWFGLPLLKSGAAGAAEEFLAAVAARDLQAARARVTEGGGHLEDGKLEAVLEQGATFAIGEVQERANTANVKYTIEGGSEELMVLILEDGQWRVTEIVGHADLSAPFIRPLSQEETVAGDFLNAIVAGDAESARKLLTAKAQESGEALLAEHIAYWETRKQRSGERVPTPHSKQGTEDEVTVKGRYESPNFGVSDADQTGGAGGGGGGGGGGSGGFGGGGRGEPPRGGGEGFDMQLLKQDGQWRVRSVRNYPPEGQGQLLSEEDIVKGARVWDYETPGS